MGFTSSFNPRQPHTWTAQQSLLVTDYPAEDNTSNAIVGWTSVITAQTASSAGTVESYVGADFRVIMNGSGEFAGQAVGLYAGSYSYGAPEGQCDQLDAIIATVGHLTGYSNPTGSITAMNALTAKGTVGPETVSFYNGLEVAQAYVSTGSLNTQVGVLIDNMVSATNNYAIKTGLGQNLLGDKLTITGRTTFNGGWARKRTTFSNVAVNILPSDGVMAQTGTMTASRVVQFPYAATVGAGWVITIIDESGTVGAVNTLYLNGMGGDLLNGAGFQLLSTAYGKASYISDGVGKWTLIG